MSPRLDVRHLQLLVALRDAGSLAEAAHWLAVTPSALSHRVKEAERRLDVVLVEKAGRGLRLTPGGEVLAEGAARILDDLARLESNVSSIAVGVEHVVRLSVGTYNAYHWLPAFLKVFAKDNPGLEVEVVADAVNHPLDRLRDGTIDLAIMGDYPLPQGMKRVPLFEDELICILPPDHDLAGRDFALAKDLAEETFYTYSLVTIPGHDWERFWRPAGLSARRTVRVELVEAIVELVKAGFGIAVLTRWAMTPYLHWGALASVRLTEKGLPIGWHAVVRSADGETSPAHHLAGELAKWCKTKKGGFDTPLVK